VSVVIRDGAARRLVVEPGDRVHASLVTGPPIFGCSAVSPGAKTAKTATLTCWPISPAGWVCSDWDAAS
jgi:hypothetical protein